MSSSFMTEVLLRGGMEAWFLLVFAMVIGHVVADYPLQGQFLAMGKNRNLDATILFGGARVPRGLWIHLLTAHSLVQAGVLWVITGSLTLALIELVAHWVIDFAKCEGWTNFHVDQALHVACKLVYAGILVAGWGFPLG